MGYSILQRPMRRAGNRIWNFVKTHGARGLLELGKVEVRRLLRLESGGSVILQLVLINLMMIAFLSLPCCDVLLIADVRVTHRNLKLNLRIYKLVYRMGSY